MTSFLPYILIGLTDGSVYGLAGTGLVLTYETSGIFNFAHGTIAALMAYAFYELRETRGLPWPLALAVCLLVLAPLVGLLLERMGRRLADAPVVMQVVATVGLVVGLQQLILIRYPSTIRAKPFLPTHAFRIFGVVVGADQLIVMAIALAGTVGLTVFLRSRAGRQMRALVDQPDLLALNGISAVKVRRRAWFIGTAFAALSGVLLASTNVGLNAPLLTLLVVQAFGAAAIGLFRSIPLTYGGGLVVGVLAALSRKYVATIAWLNGFPASVPFIILFVVLIAVPGIWLVDYTIDRKQRVVERRQLPRQARLGGGLVLGVVVLALPYIVSTRLPVYTSALAYVLMFLSLALLMRTSGQVSLGQLGFAAVGAAASARLGVDAGLPWLAAVLLGALIAVPVGALLAIPAIRRSGIYLALATFAFAVLLERLVYFTGWMFGASSSGSIPAPRPSFAHGDRAYFYVVLAFVVAAIVFVTVLHRSRLGRLLRAMADSTTALTTSGTSVTSIKVIIFCVAAFLAGLGGALLGPVTGSSGTANFGSFSSLLLVVLIVIVGGSEITASIGAALALMVVPSYISSVQFNNYLPVLFSVAAVGVAMGHAGMQAPAWLVRAAGRVRPRPDRSPITARLERRPQPEVV